MNVENEEGTDSTTGTGPADPTNGGGEQTHDGPEIDWSEYGIDLTGDEPKASKPEPAKEGEGTKAEQDEKKGVTTESGLDGVHPSLHRLAELRVEGEARTELLNHLKGWSKEREKFDADLAAHDAEKTKFESERQDYSIAKGLGDEIALADTPEKAILALRQAAKVLEDAHGYKLPADPLTAMSDGSDVPKIYDDEQDQANFAREVKAMSAFLTQKAQAETAALQSKLDAIEKRLQSVDEIEKERQSAKAETALRESVKGEYAQARAQVKQECCDYDPTEEQAQEARRAFPDKPLAEAIQLHFHKEVRAHLVKEAEKGTKKAPTLHGSGKVATGARAHDPLDISIDEIERYVAEGA